MSALTSDEFVKVRRALNYAATVGQISVFDCDDLLAKLDPNNGSAEPAAETPTPAAVDAEAAAALQAAEQAEAQKAQEAQQPAQAPAPTPPAQ